MKWKTKAQIEKLIEPWDDTRDRLRKAFAFLRKKENGHWFARMNFWCCQTCAWCEVPEGRENVLFWHGQDDDSFKETDKVTITHAGETEKAVEVLKEFGLIVDWDGTDCQRLEVS